MKKVVTIVAVMFVCFMFASQVVAEQKGHGTHWGYTGQEGPEHWGKIAPEYAVCANGLTQSPIDIQGALKTNLSPLEVSYKKVPLRIINNGHTIQINFDSGNTLTIDGKVYELLQYHFHTPSEHKVGGKAYDGELHLVHKGKDGDLAVIGVFIEKGQANQTIQTLLDNIPDTVNKERSVRGIMINAADLFPQELGFYRYYGSLTTPPCSEIVIWTVLKTPIQASEEQLQKLSKVMDKNARPVNPVGRRFILESK